MHPSLTAYPLPATDIADELCRQVSAHHSVVVTAPPGAGKSTLLPLVLLEILQPGEKLILLEPRRIAARQVAERMASMLGESVGQTVGYRVRKDTCVGRNTRIEVVTEGILTRMLIADPTLEGVGLVIFDEFHERNLNTDEALALTRETQRILRDDLRIVIMSATIDATTICTELSAPLVESPGRMFPVEIIYSEDEAKPQNCAEVVAHAIRVAHREHEGDILAFLPGEYEINRVSELLGDTLLPTRVCPLYGRLSPEEQRHAIAPSATGERKVVLATPVAETSLTIEGVRVVVDSGLCRKPVYHPQQGMSHLETVRISLDMATQRSGRAGRVAPGVCYRLWTKATESRMKEQRSPEILDADLTGPVLDIAAFGVSIEDLLWMTPPPTKAVAEARSTLRMLDALDSNGVITPIGRQINRQPCHPRLGHMRLAATTDDDQHLADRLTDILEGLRRGPIPDTYEAGRLLAAAYPERIRRIGEHSWIVAAEMLNDKVYSSAPIREEDLAPYIRSRDVIRWDVRTGTLLSHTEQRVGNTVLSTRPLARPSTEEIVEAIAVAAQKDYASIFDFNEDLRRMQLRLDTVRHWHPELELPTTNDASLMADIREWLPTYLPTLPGLNLQKLSLAQVLWNRLNYDQQQTVERIAPAHITVPTGSRIRVDYRQGAELPIVSVRLQECFGLTDTPRVDEGRRPVLMELLSPGYKPVQLTSDLASFWSGTYFEVKKELRRRYPKHSWPDNPLEAEAVRGVKRHNV